MQELTELLSTSDWVYWGLAGLIGACVGSFINVVIYRYPKLLAHHWQIECHDFLNIQPKTPVEKPSFSLYWPASHCPHCQTQIKIYDNIPVLSFVLLKGRCRQCHKAISYQYPLIESVSLLFSVITAMHFGFGWQAAAALVLTWWLICQSGIDIKEQLIPDQITYIGLWVGLLINTQSVFTSINDAIFGAVVGYLSLWLIYHVYKLLTGKEGMGYGDFKLLAMLGAWLGLAAIPWIIILSSMLGVIGGVTFLFAKGLNRDTPIPFGPYLALAGWLVLLWGQEFTNWYLQFSGLGNT